MSGVGWGTLRQGFHRAALPIVSYYAVTVGVPLVNGAAQSGAAPFVKHAITVVVVPPIVIVLACAVHSIVRAQRGAIHALSKQIDKSNLRRGRKESA